MGLALVDRSLVGRPTGGAGILLRPVQGCGPGVGAQVGPHRCPTLRPGAAHYRMSRGSVADPLGSGGTRHRHALTTAYT
jgi:hypothetical protein